MTDRTVTVTVKVDGEWKFKGTISAEAGESLIGMILKADTDWQRPRRSPKAAAKKPRKKATHYGKKLADLLAAGEVVENDRLLGRGYNGEAALTATLRADGRIELADGSVHKSPSTAGKAAASAAGRGPSSAQSGWDFWTVERTGEKLHDHRLRCFSRPPPEPTSILDEPPRKPPPDRPAWKPTMTPATLKPQRSRDY